MSSQLAGSEFTGASPNVLEGAPYYGFEDAGSTSTFAGSYVPVTAQVQQCGGKRTRFNKNKSKKSMRKNSKNNKKTKSRRIKAKSMKKKMKKSMRKSHNKSMKNRRSLKALNRRR